MTNSSGGFAAPVSVPASQSPGIIYITAVGRGSGLAAQAALTISTPWTEGGFGAGHHGWNAFENTLGVNNVSALGISWMASIGSNGNGSTPVIAKGRVVISSATNVAQAFATDTGAPLWTGPAGQSYAAPAISGASVYATGYSQQGLLYNLNSHTGAQIWVKSLTGASVSSPVVVGGVVYVTSYGATNSQGTVYAFDATTGATDWTYSVTGGHFDTDVAVAEGTVFVGSTNNTFYALNATTGALLWSYATDGGIETSAAVTLGVVYFGSDDGRVYALNASNGKVLWSRYTGGEISASPCYANGVIYISSVSGVFYALDATTNTLLWSITPTSTLVSGTNTLRAAVVANGILYFTLSNTAESDGIRYAVNAGTGAILASSAAGGSFFGSPSVSDGIVYLNAYGGNIFAFALNAGLDPDRAPKLAPSPGTLFPDYRLTISN